MKARVANISEPSFEDIPVWLLPDTGVGFEIVNDVNFVNGIIEGLGVVESRECLLECKARQHFPDIGVVQRPRQSCRWRTRLALSQLSQE